MGIARKEACQASSKQMGGWQPTVRVISHCWIPLYVLISVFVGSEDITKWCDSDGMAVARYEDMRADCIKSIHENCRRLHVGMECFYPATDVKLKGSEAATDFDDLNNFSSAVDHQKGEAYMEFVKYWNAQITKMQKIPKHP